MQYLAVLKVKPETKGEQLGPLMKPEAAKAWEMTTSGALRSIHYIKGPAGAVLMFEAAAEKEVSTLVGELPLVRAGLVSVEILSLVPYAGFASLFSAPPE